MPAREDFGFGGPLSPHQGRGGFEYRVVRSTARGGECLCVDVVGMTPIQARKLEARFLDWLLAYGPGGEIS